MERYRAYFLVIASVALLFLAILFCLELYHSFEKKRRLIPLPVSIPEMVITPRCDTAIVHQEFHARLAALIASGQDWKSCISGSSQCLEWMPKRRNSDVNRKNAASHSLHYYPDQGELYEEEVYWSGKKLPRYDPDYADIDTILENLQIKFSYCEEQTQYEFTTGNEKENQSCFGDDHAVNRLSVDSILRTWGHQRILPPEDFNWLFREKLLEKAEEKERKR